MKKYMPLSLFLVSLITIPVVGFSENTTAISAKTINLTESEAIERIKSSQYLLGLVKSEGSELNKICKDSKQKHNCYVTHVNRFYYKLKSEDVNISPPTLLKVIEYFR